MMQLLHPIRCWLWRVKLTLVLQEIEDTLDDMRHALFMHEFGKYQALADFHSELCREAKKLRALLGISSH